MSATIAIVKIYRGVGIHDCQPRERIEGMVKPAIDAVHKLTSAKRLASYCEDVTRPPEARLFAAAKVEAMFEVATDARTPRPDVDLERVQACVAGLSSRGWRSPQHYGSILDPPPPPGAPAHALRPPEYQRLVEEDRRAAEDERCVGSRAPAHGDEC